LRPRLLVSLVVLSLALAGSTGPASAAIQTTNLSLTGFSHMAVDDARHHVFVTGAQADGVVVVMNEDGTSAGSIPGIGGASGMVLTGGTLYVARCGAGSITEVDPATLAAVGSFAADVTGTCDLVAAGGRLWYPSSAGLASVSLDSSHTVVTPGTALPDGMLASSSGQPDQLVEGDADHAGPTVRVYDVTDPTGPTLLGSQAFGGGQVVDMAVTPDGATLLLAQHSSPFKATVRTLPTLGAPSGVTQYGLNRPANAIAVSPNGAKIATGTDDGIADDDVLVFNPGATVSKRFWDFGGTTNVLYPRGLAFSSSGASLFAVSGDVSGAHTVKFHSLSTLPAGSLTIATTKATVLYGHAVTVTAHLGTASSNKRVSIYRKPTTGGAARLVVQGRVNAKGNLKVKVKPAANTIYTATWDGDASHMATATAKGRRVRVRVVMHAKTKGGYLTSGGYRLYHYAKSCTGASHTGCPTFAGSAAPSHPGYTFHLVSQAFLGGRWRAVVKGQGVTNAKGKLVVKIFYTNKAAVGVRQRIRFSLADHSDHLGNISAWAYFRVT
jgi:hypothetical protein